MSPSSVTQPPMWSYLLVPAGPHSHHGYVSCSDPIQARAPAPLGMAVTSPEIGVPPGKMLPNPEHHNPAVPQWLCLTHAPAQALSEEQPGASSVLMALPLKHQNHQNYSEPPPAQLQPARCGRLFLNPLSDCMASRSLPPHGEERSSGTFPSMACLLVLGTWLPRLGHGGGPPPPLPPCQQDQEGFADPVCERHHTSAKRSSPSPVGVLRRAGSEDAPLHPSSWHPRAMTAMLSESCFPRESYKCLSLSWQLMSHFSAAFPARSGRQER